jgi:hypothetical protein
LIDPMLLPDTYLFMSCYDARFCHPGRTMPRLYALLDVAVVEQPASMEKAQAGAVGVLENPLATEHAKSVALAVDRLIVLAFWRREHRAEGEQWEVSQASFLAACPAQAES